MASRTKYGKNRQLWRKVYGSRRRKPDTAFFVDSITNVTISYDLHRTLRHRDYFIIKSSITASLVVPPGLSFAEYDEGLISFVGTDSETASFNFTFSAVPDAVVLSIDPVADSSGFIIPYGISFDDTSVSIGLSAPFTGDVRYRAVYSSGGYPALATSSLEPTSGTFKISAGKVTTLNTTAYTASYGTLATSPTLFYRTPWDIFSMSGSDVDLTKESATVELALGEISAPFSGSVHFIAVE